MTREVLAKDSSTGRDGLGGVGMGRDRRKRRTPRKTRDELRALWGESAHRIVTAYTDRRFLAGFPPADRKGLGALAGQAMRLLDSGGWDEPTLTTAAVSFADTKRFPGYFEEWASEILTRADVQVHRARRAEENLSLPPEVLAAMGRLGRME